jgi:hypothetical protein
VSEKHAAKQLEQIQLMMQTQPCPEYICAGRVVCVHECAGLKLQASQGKSKPEQADCCGQTAVCWLRCGEEASGVVSTRPGLQWPSESHVSLYTAGGVALPSCPTSCMSLYVGLPWLIARRVMFY